MAATLFEKIIRREVDADIVYEDDQCLAFRDINPQAPTHVLIIPKQFIEKISTAEEQDKTLLGHLLLAAQKVARQLGCHDYRLVINNGERAGQTIFHLHIHLLAGRMLSWPPG